ncbi:hypothetical protein AB3S75_000086 [Citrus x aurantiifolia]
MLPLVIQIATLLGISRSFHRKDKSVSKYTLHKQSSCNYHHSQIQHPLHSKVFLPYAEIFAMIPVSSNVGSQQAWLGFLE